MAGVIGDRAGKVLPARRIFQHVVREALGAFPNGSIVDRIGPDWIHSASATTRTERNDCPKGVIQSLPLLLGNMIDDLLAVRLITIFGQPDAKVFGSLLAERAPLDGILNGGQGLLHRIVGSHVDNTAWEGQGS